MLEMMKDEYKKENEKKDKKSFAKIESSNDLSN
jgi:hypothetical protein